MLDNSVCMRWLFCDGMPEDRAYAARVLQHMIDDVAEAVVPGLWPLEAGNVMVRAEARQQLSEARSAEFLGVLGGMNIRTDADTASRALHDTLQLARRFRLSTYDASYLELALREALPLATLDENLRRALRDTGGQLL